MLRDFVGNKSQGEHQVQGTSSSAFNPISNSINQFIDVSRNRADYMANRNDFSSESTSSDLSHLDLMQKQKLRDRSSILGKHIHPEKGDVFVDQQVRAFQQKLNIDPGTTGPMSGYNSLNMNASTFGDYQSDSRALMEHRASENYDFPDIDIGELSALNLNMDSELQSMMSGQNYQEYMEMFKKQFSLDNIHSHTEPYRPIFQQQNRFASHSDPTSAAEAAYNQGDLFLAIEALEESLKRRETAEGWRRLGNVLAEADDDERAISCFTRAVRVDPSDLQSLMNLGVSYTNELNKIHALVYLHHWLASHPLYSHVIQEKEIRDYNFHMLHTQILNAVQNVKSSETENDIDMITGVLFHLVEDYQRAIECFRRAVKKNPNDFTAWNKLGATHANNREGAKAVECYRRALNIRPNYLRAWVNLGIAYANDHKNKEAVVAFLRVLSMAKNVKGRALSHVWNYLSLSFTFMQREDLVALCEQKDVELFRSEFSF